MRCFNKSASVGIVSFTCVRRRAARRRKLKMGLILASVSGLGMSDCRARGAGGYNTALRRRERETGQPA